MQVLRQVGIYSLIRSSQSESKTLKYYIDNKEEVSEYMDEYEVKPLFLYSDEEFEEFCLELFI